MKYIINQKECGYLIKNGVFIRILMAGKYHFLKELGYEVKIVSMSGPVKTWDIPVEILRSNQDFASKVIHIEIPDTSIAIHFVNKAYRDVITAQEALYWNVYESNEFQLVDMTDPYMERSLPRIYMDLMPAKFYKKVTIKDGEIGLLYFDNRFEKRLEPGNHYFWIHGAEVSCKIFNMKMQQIDISGQEILTADKVCIRLNVICNYRITNPEKMVQMIDGSTAQLYTYAQLVIRDYVGSFRLDELLAQKEDVGQCIYELMKAKQDEYFVEIMNAGIKDIILPGEIRDIMNTVLIAEKKAQANVIMRREEVASTRSLLNTARLMDENQTLLKLKEMEYLERICDKVGSISLHGGKGVLDQLSDLAGI